MKEQILKLRRSLDLTQQEFADRIGTARNNIAGYETGKRSPSGAVATLICKEFGVNEVWLRTGEGGDENMFTQSTHDIIDTSNDIKSMIIGAVNIMNDKQLTRLWDYIVKNFTNGGDKVGKTD